MPLLNGRLRERDLPASLTHRAPAYHALEGYAQRLIQVSPGRTTDFAEFSAFDLAMDDSTLASVEAIREVAGSTDVVDQQLRCLCSLLRLEPNPDRTQTFLSVLAPLLVDLEDRAQPEAVLSWLVRLRDVLVSVKPRRPEVAKCLDAAVQALCTRERAAWLIETYRAGPAARPVVTGYVNALAPTIAPVFAALLDDRRVQAKLPALIDLVCDHAAGTGAGTGDTARARKPIRHASDRPGPGVCRWRARKGRRRLPCTRRCDGEARGAGSPRTNGDTSGGAPCDRSDRRTGPCPSEHRLRCPVATPIPAGQSPASDDPEK